MLISMDTGDATTRMQHNKQRKQWYSRMTNAEWRAIRDELQKTQERP